MTSGLPIPDRLLILHTKAAGDTVEWSPMRVTKALYPCDVCSAQLHEARGKGPSPARAHKLRTLRPVGRELALCRAHAVDWEVRDNR